MALLEETMGLPSRFFVMYASSRAFESLPSRIRIQSPSNWRASNQNLILESAFTLILHSQLEARMLGKSCGDDVNIPSDDVSVQPQEHESVVSVRD